MPRDNEKERKDRACTTSSKHSKQRSLDAQTYDMVPNRTILRIMTRGYENCLKNNINIRKKKLQL